MAPLVPVLWRRRCMIRPPTLAFRVTPFLWQHGLARVRVIPFPCKNEIVRSAGNLQMADASNNRGR